MNFKSPIPTIWRVSDLLWSLINAILLRFDPPAPIGRNRIDQRAAFNGIIFRFRSGCQWDQLPKEFGDSASVHRTFQRWVEKGVLPHLWAEIISECDELNGVDWNWQAADGCLGKARMGGDKVGPNPTDRGKPGTKKSILVDGKGGPLGVALGGANTNDFKLLQPTISSIVVDRPDTPQTLFLDKGYDNPTGRKVTEENGYIPEISKIKVEPNSVEEKPRKINRRYVVERTLAWLSKCRGLLVRYEKKAENYLGYLQIACLLIWFRRFVQLSIP